MSSTTHPPYSIHEYSDDVVIELINIIEQVFYARADAPLPHSSTEG
jgi:hypothetical protein